MDRREEGYVNEAKGAVPDQPRTVGDQPVCLPVAAYLPIVAVALPYLAYLPICLSAYQQ